MTLLRHLSCDFCGHIRPNCECRYCEVCGEVISASECWACAERADDEFLKGLPT